MGDRANLIISYKSTAAASTLAMAIVGALALYAHDGGHDLGPNLAKALRESRGRWTDDGYGARIIVSQMIGDDWSGEYGFGLYVGEIGDNERAILLVDFEDQKVRRLGEPGKYLSPSDAMEAKPTAEWTFTEFAAMSDDEARAAHLG